MDDAMYEAPDHIVVVVGSSRVCAVFAECVSREFSDSGHPVRLLNGIFCAGRN
jgi:hypothetical protein